MTRLFIYFAVFSMQYNETRSLCPFNLSMARMASPRLSSFRSMNFLAANPLQLQRQRHCRRNLS
ncbi:hypothetical protein X989_5073 [Burkholderia pseudomallei MSHR4378]|nr:hypothetical protein X989_5073 [Burkholderia pseudomallei MSHR4378]